MVQFSGLLNPGVKIYSQTCHQTWLAGKWEIHGNPHILWRFSSLGKSFKRGFSIAVFDYRRVSQCLMLEAG